MFHGDFTNIYFKFQATMMQQMYANYMTQYIQYLQSVGAMYQMPSANTQDVVDHPNQITDEARAALGVGAEAPQAQVLNHVAAAAMAGAMAHGGAGGLPQQEQPHQPAAAPVAAANPGVDVAAAVADAPSGTPTGQTGQLRASPRGRMIYLCTGDMEPIAAATAASDGQ